MTANDAPAPVPVLAVEPATALAWDAAVSECGAATAFHTRAWAEAWQRATRARLRPAAREVRFADGMRAVLPLSERREANGRSTLCVPGDGYGGWVAGSTLHPGHAAGLGHVLAEMAAADVALEWRLHPLDPLARRAWIPVPRSGRGETEARVLDLAWARATGRSILARLGGLTEAAARAAAAATTVRAAATVGEWRAWWSARARGTGTVEEDWDVVRELHAAGSGLARLWLGEREDRIVAGELIVYGPAHATRWRGLGGEPDARALVLRKVIAGAERDGHRWLDLQPPGHDEPLEPWAVPAAQRLPAPLLRAAAAPAAAAPAR